MLTSISLYCSFLFSWKLYSLSWYVPAYVPICLFVFLVCVSRFALVATLPTLPRKVRHTNASAVVVVRDGLTNPASVAQQWFLPCYQVWAPWVTFNELYLFGKKAGIVELAVVRVIFLFRAGTSDFGNMNRLWRHKWFNQSTLPYTALLDKLVHPSACYTMSNNNDNNNTDRHRRYWCKATAALEYQTLIFHKHTRIIIHHGTCLRS